MPRIYELGGKLPDDVEFQGVSACLPDNLPQDPTDVQAISKVP